MSTSPQKNFDVRKRQKHLFDAAVRNSLLANEAIKMAQESMLALGLAELAFLGVLLLDKDRSSRTVKSLVILLVISFLLFLFGQIRQYKHQLKAARVFESKSIRALEYLADGKEYLEGEPKDISLEKKQIKSDNLANWLIFISLILIVLVTIRTIWLVVEL